jgi:hypothetical protein
MKDVDAATLKLFKAALRKSLELNIVPFNISLARFLFPEYPVPVKSWEHCHAL